MWGTVLGFLGQLLKTLIPILAYFKGKSAAKDEVKLKNAEQEARDRREALHAMDTVHTLTDDELRKRVYRNKSKPPK